MSELEAKMLYVKFLPLDALDKTPNQADGATPLEALGAVITTFERDGITLYFHGYIVRNLSQPVLCGLPFMEKNNIVQYISRRTMTVQGKTLMEDPPISPGSSLPFHVQEVPLSNPLSQIEIGKNVPKGLKL